MYDRKGYAIKVSMKNVSSRVASCPAHFAIMLWLLHKLLPRNEDYIRIGPSKYRDWQVLAYENIMDKQLFRIEQLLHVKYLWSATSGSREMSLHATYGYSPME